MDDFDKVCTFMQKASKRTRSYYVNANGLRGFVIPCLITKYLKRAKDQNQLEEVTKHQLIDMDALFMLLDKMKSNEERKEYLGIQYPCLYIFVQ